MNIIKRERILIDIEDLVCDDIGLFALFKDHNLEFKHISLTNRVPWKTFIHETLGLTFFYLLIKKNIDIEVVEFEESHFFKLYKTRKRVFEIKSIKPGVRTSDILSDTILKLIEEKSNTTNKQFYFNHIILSLFNEYLDGRGTYLKPEKEFFLKNLNRYVKKFDWLTIEEVFHSFGPLFRYNVNVEPIYIPRLKMQHGSLYDFYKSISASNVYFKWFNLRLKEVLDYNYSVRSSFGGNSNRHGGWEFPIPNL